MKSSVLAMDVAVNWLCDSDDGFEPHGLYGSAGVSCRDRRPASPVAMVDSCAQSLASIVGVGAGARHGWVASQRGILPTGSVVPGMEARGQWNVSEFPTNPGEQRTSHSTPKCTLLQLLTSTSFAPGRVAQMPTQIGAVPTGSAVGSMLSNGHTNSASVPELAT